MLSPMSWQLLFLGCCPVAGAPSEHWIIIWPPEYSLKTNNMVLQIIFREHNFILMEAIKGLSFLKILKDQIRSIRSQICTLRNWIGWQWLVRKWIFPITMRYGMPCIWSHSDYQSQRSDKVAVWAGRGDQGQCDRMLTKICTGCPKILANDSYLGM
jgi:hypothetical protein